MRTIKFKDRTVRIQNLHTSFENLEPFCARQKVDEKRVQEELKEINLHHFRWITKFSDADPTAIDLLYLSLQSDDGIKVPDAHGSELHLVINLRLSLDKSLVEQINTITSHMLWQSFAEDFYY